MFFIVMSITIQFLASIIHLRKQTDTEFKTLALEYEISCWIN